jgi:hypothetical protein
MGQGGLVPARARLVTREQAQLIRLLLMCIAWAIGQTLTIGLSADLVSTVVPGALAVGVYVVTDDLGRGGFGGGEAKYWRGRRIDDDKPRGGRWN